MTRDEWIAHIMKLINDMEDNKEIEARLQEMYGAAPEASNAKLREALERSRDRFSDLANIIRRNGPYDDAGFMEASAERCQSALNGGDYNSRSAID